MANQLSIMIGWSGKKFSARIKGEDNFDEMYNKR